jgi:hypothetical protein
MWKMAVVWKWLVLCSLLWTVPSQAALLDPLAFTSLGTLNITDTITINTDTLQLTGGVSYTGVLEPVSGAGVFTFDDISGTNLPIFGTRTLGLLSKGNLSFMGTIDLLGRGGLEMAALGTMTLANVQTTGSGGTVSLTASQLNVGGVVDVGIRPLGIRTFEPINLIAPTILVNESGGRDVGPSSQSGLTLLTGTRAEQRTATLGSGLITLTAATGTASGPVSTAGQIFGTSDVSIVAPVPLPAAFPLFAAGLGSIALALRRR